MIGFTQYNPAVLNLIINREKFYPFVAGEGSSTEEEKLSEWLRKDSDRTKVLLVDTLRLLKKYASKYDLSNVKVVVFDSLFNLRGLFLELVDTAIKSDGSCEYFSMTPDIFNTALEDCSPGVPSLDGDTDNEDGLMIENRDGMTVVKDADRNTIMETINSNSNSATLSDILEKITASLSDKKKNAITKRIVEYVLGMRKIKKLPITKAKYNIKGDALDRFLNSEYCGRLSQAYLDLRIFSAEKDVVSQYARVSRKDLDIVSAYASADDFPLKKSKKRGIKGNGKRSK